MNVSIEECFQRCVDKLEINPDNFEKIVKRSFIEENEKEYKLFVYKCIHTPEQTKHFDIKLSFNDYLLMKLETAEYKEKFKLYDQLIFQKHSNDHEGILQTFGYT